MAKWTKTCTMEATMVQETCRSEAMLEEAMPTIKDTTVETWKAEEEATARPETCKETLKLEVATMAMVSTMLRLLINNSAANLVT